MEVPLYDASLVDRDRPGHQVAHGFDEPAVHQVLRLTRVDDLPADVDGTPRAIDLDGLLRVDRDLDNIRHIAGVRELERDALARAFGQRTAAIPRRHVAHGLEHAARARRVESAGSASADRVVQQIDSVLQRILAGGDGDFVDEALLHERDAVGGWRAQRPDGDAEGRDVLGRDQHVLDEASRELVRGHDGVRAGDEIAIRDELATRIQARLEEMVSRRAVLVVRHVVFARPQQLDRDARQARDRPLLGDEPGDPRYFDVVLAYEPPAESAAGTHEMERHVLGRNARAERRMLLGRNLA